MADARVAQSLKAERKGVMSRSFSRLAAFIAVMVPAVASAQINFEKSQYYVAMGDSVAAGEGAMPVTNGYAYQLYDHGVFAPKQVMDFANVAVRGGRTWELRDHQVAEVLCTTPAQRPTIVTITAGANDFFRGDFDIVGIAQRVAESINLLLNNGTPYVVTPVLDPITHAPCPRLTNVTILVSNYYHIPIPVPEVNAVVDNALAGFDQVMRALLPFIPVPAGSKVGYVDLYGASADREGLVLVERRLGFTGPFDWDPHPTNLGHTFIAGEFAKVFQSLQ
jgi:lysophospholipase L1-like esterase